jgi:hypothetical protein
MHFAADGLPLAVKRTAGETDQESNNPPSIRRVKKILKGEITEKIIILTHL